MYRKVGFFAVFAFALGCSGANASVAWPNAPTNPSSIDECHALYDRYSAIARELSDAARAAARRAAYDVNNSKAIYGQFYPSTPTSREEYATSKSLYDQASEARLRGGRAKNACIAQVRAQPQKARSAGTDYNAIVRRELADGISNSILENA
ncbi:MAG: hypothetical protein AAFO72_07610 [Pseudomonadota bacterium]